VKLLLDTCTFLWIASRSPLLSPRASAVFLDESQESYLSVASAWEISVKHTLGRLPLPERPDTWVPRVREGSGIAGLEINEECALLAGRLPRIHDDPFDRLLVAQAIVHGLTLVTPDPEIHKYAVRVLW